MTDELPNIPDAATCTPTEELANTPGLPACTPMNSTQHSHTSAKHIVTIISSSSQDCQSSIQSRAVTSHAVTSHAVTTRAVTSRAVTSRAVYITCTVTSLAQ